MMRPLLYFGLSVLLLSCADSVDEQVIARRIEQNNVLLEKQVNLLQREFLLNMQLETDNPGRMLYEQSESWLAEASKKLDSYHNPEQSTEVFHTLVNRFNDSMKQYSALLLDWSPEPMESGQADLLRSWQKNNLLLLELDMIERCMELYKNKSEDASRSLVPVIYTNQFYQVQKGKNAIFDVAFKSKKPEGVRIQVKKALLNGKSISLKKIEVDRYTQRFILFNLEKGDYLIEGVLEMTNDKGENEIYPFRQEFHVD